MSRRREKDGNPAARTLDRLTGKHRRTLALSAWASVAGSLILIAELGCVALAIAEILRGASVSAAFTYLAAFLILRLHASLPKASRRRWQQMQPKM